MWVSGSFHGFNSDLLCVQSFEIGRGAFRDKVVTDPVAGCRTSLSLNLRFISLFIGNVMRINVEYWTLRREKKNVNVLKSSNILENCALLGYYAASSGNFLPTFRDNVSVPFSGFKNPKESL
jgi:hypothetical protein